MIRGLYGDERGETTTSVLGFTLTWFVVFFVFLMNVELGQLFHRRDVVDHAGAVAADVAKKTYCAKKENASAAEGEAKRAVDPVLQTAGSQGCNVSVRPGGEGSDPGSKELDVTVECSFDCKVPIAAQVMCKGGKTKFEAKQKTVAMGCDGQGG